MGTNKKPEKKPAEQKPKADNAEVAKRVEEVLRIRLDGAQFHDIVQYAAEKGWGLKDRQIRTYIQRADDLLVERRDKNRKRIVARHLAQREALFARAVNAADHRTALAIVDSIAKLQGLFPDARDLKELARLAAEQGNRIRELENHLETTRRHSEPTAPKLPPTGTPPSGATDGTA